MNPRVATERSPRGLLPHAGRLIGRDEELARLADVVRNANGRVVTITGAGGCGKTRLAMEAARTLGADFEDGAAFVDLAPTHHVEQVAGEIMRALDLVERPQDDPVEQLVAALGLQRRLVVLDNFEHLLGAATTVATLAARCPSSVLVVTSRRRLNVRDEQTIQLRPLAVPEGNGPGPSDELADVASVAMFCERAHAVTPRFTAEPASLPVIAEICRRLDGLPLAIELTAAYVRLLPPEALLARLSGRDGANPLGLLGRGAVDASPHHRTMRDTISWSHDLLDEPARRLLRRLAIFTGGWTLDAMEDICTDGDAADALNALVELVDLHLVQPDHGRAEQRFHLLETVRMFARERLVESGELDELATKHALYYADLAGRAGRGLESAEQRRWALVLDHELPNVRVALEYLARTGRWADGLVAVVALQPYWLDRGPVREGRQWLDRFLGGTDVPEVLRAAADGWTIRLAVESGEIDGAAGAELVERLDRARRVVGTADDWEWLRLTEHMSYLVRTRGDFEAMERLIDEGLRRCDEATGCDWLRVELLTRRASTARDRTDTATALALLEDTVRLAAALGYDRARARVALSVSVLRDGPRVVARSDVEETFELLEELGDRRGAVMACATAASLAVFDRDLADAIRWYRSCIDLGLRCGYLVGVEWGMMGLVPIATVMGRIDDASRLHGSLRPRLEALGPVTPALLMTSYNGFAARMEKEVGPEQFARLCQAGEDRPWAEAVDEAKRLADELRAAAASHGEAGGLDLSPAVPSRRSPVRRGPRDNPELTTRERDVLRELVRGLTNQGIAESLGMSPKTVMHHTGSVYRKLGVRGRAEAVAHALRTGLVAG